MTTGEAAWYIKL